MDMPSWKKFHKAEASKDARRYENRAFSRTGVERVGSKEEGRRRPGDESKPLKTNEGAHSRRLKPILGLIDKTRTLTESRRALLFVSSERGVI